MLSQILHRCIPFTKTQRAELSLLEYQKDYTTEALSFINNCSRTLNYWGEGGNNLLPNNNNTGHYRFSFHDLVWLSIVYELREFGMGKDRIMFLKENLLDRNTFFDYQLQKAPAELIELYKNVGFDEKQAHEIVNTCIQEKNNGLTNEDKFLFNYINQILLYRVSVVLNIDAWGHHEVLVEEDISALNKNLRKLGPEVYKNTHISIHLTGVVGALLAKEYVHDEVKQNFFTDDEWSIITTIRKEKPSSISIKFDESGRVEQMEITKLSKVKIEARLTEIITRGAYETITIGVREGKPIYLKKQKRIK